MSEDDHPESGHDVVREHREHAGHEHAGHEHGGGRPGIERRCDVAIVGGSAAGLAAALQLGRQRRSVIVIDAGEPRNAAASHMHSFLGRDGTPPGALLGAGREEVRSYGGEIIDGTVTVVTRTAASGGDPGDPSNVVAPVDASAGDGSFAFRLELPGDRVVLARRLLAATGIVDELPDIEGLDRHWGSGVIHCPFCHGYEVRDRRIVQIVTHPMDLHPTVLLRRLTDQLTVVVHDGAGIEATQLDRLRAGGIDVLEAPVGRLLDRGDGGGLAAVELTDGVRLDADAVLVGPRFRPRVEPFRELGLVTEPHPSGLGEVVVTDPSGATSVPGLYAAGNLTDPSQQVLAAAAAGSWVGGQIAFALASEDLATASRPSASEADWDRRYDGGQMWSGNPNGSVVAEVGGLVAGRALDVGAGEGGDAIWLAQEGWRVTAADVSGRALARLGAVAVERELSIDLAHVDAGGIDAFAGEQYDLVTASYASIPRSPDDRAVHNVLDAVAPGGVLLVVGHDLEPMRSARGETGHGAMAFDPDSYVRVADFVRVIEASHGWQVEVHETRPRPAGAASGDHHVDDEVLRARRVA